MTREDVDNVPITVSEAARFFGVAPTTVWTWIDNSRKTGNKVEPVGIRKRQNGKGQSPYEYRFGDIARLEREARTVPSGRTGRIRKSRR